MVRKLSFSAVSTLTIALIAAPALAQVPAPAAPGAPAPEAPAPAPAAPATPAPEAASPASDPAATAAPEAAGAATAAPATATAAGGLPPAPPATLEEAPPAGPKKLGVGSKGYFQPGLLLQGWYTLTSQGVADGPDTAHGFRMRRAEFKAKGELIPERVGYLLMIDAAKTLRFGSETVPVENQDPAPTDPAAPEQVEVPTPPGDTSILQDVAITLMSDYADVCMGQFKSPVSLESVTSSSKLPFPERALVARAFGDRRDLGIKAEKKFEHVGYVVGVWNGEGQNRLDSNRQKDASLRFEVYPMEGLLLGVVGYAGIGDRDEPNTRDRVEGDFRLELADALLQVEYVHGWIGPVTGRSDDTDRVEGHGGYALAGYTIAEKVQPVVRLGFLDENVREADSITRHYEFGLNYFALKTEVKFQAAYGLFSEDEDPDVKRHEATLAAQLSF